MFTQVRKQVKGITQVAAVSLLSLTGVAAWADGTCATATSEAPMLGSIEVTSPVIVLADAREVTQLGSMVVAVSPLHEIARLGNMTVVASSMQEVAQLGDMVVMAPSVREVAQLGSLTVSAPRLATYVEHVTQPESQGESVTVRERSPRAVLVQ